MKGDALWVVILEDNPEDSNRLETFLQRFATEHQRKIVISVFRDGIDLLDAMNSGFDVLFMDIELLQMNGMKTARKLRKLDTLIPIIFVTNLAQYAIKGYEVDAVGFMVKPISYYPFEHNMQKALKLCEKNLGGSEDYVIELSFNKFKRVPIDEIVYVIKDKNYVVYVLSSGEEIRERETMKEVEERFQNTTVKKCASGCLVNLKYVKKKDKNTVYLPDIAFPITRTCRDSFTEALMDYIRGGR